MQLLPAPVLPMWRGRKCCLHNDLTIKTPFVFQELTQMNCVKYLLSPRRLRCVQVRLLLDESFTWLMSAHHLNLVMYNRLFLWSHPKWRLCIPPTPTGLIQTLPLVSSLAITHNSLGRILLFTCSLCVLCCSAIYYSQIQNSYIMEQVNCMV